MAQKDVDTLTDRAEDAWNQKLLWEDELEDAYDYAMPNRNRYDEEETPGENKTEKLYDSTAIQATQSFASKLQNKLTPPFEDWFSLTAGPILENMFEDNSDKMHEVNKQLDRITNMVNQVFNLGSFNQAIHEFYLDLATGQGGMLVQPGDSQDRPVKFTAVNRADYAIEDGANNEITSVYRKMKVCGRDIEQQWNDADLPQKLEKKIDDDEDQEFEFWEITYESERDDASSPNDTVWYYDVIWEEGNDSDENRIVERTFRSNPWIIARWSKLAGENEGRGPLLNALPDIRTLNKVVELTLKNASLAISGAYTVANDGVTNPNNIQIKPGAIIPVARNGGPNGPSIAPLQTQRNFDVGQIVADDLRMQIKSMLFDSGVPEQRGKTPNSAYEIAQRTENLQQEIGGSFGRLFKELIVPLVQRTIDILFANNMIEIPAKVDTLGIRLQVTSPLARGQNLDDVKNVTQWVDLVRQVAGDQGIIGKSNPDEIIQFFADKLGIPTKLVKSRKEQKKMMQEMQKMAQKAQQVQSQQGQGQAQPQQAQTPQAQPEA